MEVFSRWRDIDALPVDMAYPIYAKRGVDGLIKVTYTPLGAVRHCQAVRSGDEMHCGRCGLIWAVDGDDQPACRTMSELINRLRGELK